MNTIQHLIFLAFLTQSSSCQQVRDKDYEIKVEIVGDSASPVYFGTPERERGSSFLGDYLAPENGYLKSLAIPFDSSEKAKNISRKNEGNYYFRVRTVRDANGHIISSNYGKIHGDFMLWSLPLEQGGVAQISWIACYFNPTPNGWGQSSRINTSAFFANR